MGILEELRCYLAMGICLDTGYRRETPLSLEGVYKERSVSPVTKAENQPTASVASDNILNQESSISAVVIFFLGGPGSGKMAHAQNLADLHSNYRHINMTVIMSEYVKENALGPPDHLSPPVTLALLAREFQNSSQCKAFLVTGYPRHLGDLRLFTDKLGPPMGAILLEWEKRSLVRNIELGKLDGAILLEYHEVGDDDGMEENHVGQMIIESARKELSQFYAKVLPLCEHLDNLGLLYVVSGDRAQEEIFSDVQKAHSRILKPNLAHPHSRTSIGSYREFRQMVPFAEDIPTSPQIQNIQNMNPDDVANNNLPPCIFLMGGPGSNKGSLVNEMMYLYPGWASINVGGIFRTRVTSWRRGQISPEGLPNDKLELIENLLAKGDLIPHELVMEVLNFQLQELVHKEGIIIIGFPRDVAQAQIFEQKFGHIPPLILLDCSELELGRSLGRRETRIDDNVQAAHRRLGIYRQVTLPMLKAFDEKNRLRIIDGDADIDQVIKQLKRTIYVETRMFSTRNLRSAQIELFRKDCEGRRNGKGVEEKELEGDRKEEEENSDKDDDDRDSILDYLSEHNLLTTSS